MPRHKQSDPTSIMSQVIRLRVTEAEAEKFKKKAAEAGCRSISEYIRMKCIDDEISVSVDTTEVKSKIAKMK